MTTPAALVKEVKWAITKIQQLRQMSAAVEYKSERNL